MPPRKRLGQLLTELGVVDEHQLQSALGHQKQWGGKLGAVLVQKGFCKEAEVVNALSKHLGMAQVKLAAAKIDPRAVKFVSKQIAEKLHVFPYEIAGSGRSEVVTIAMSDPTDLSAVDQLAFHTGKRIKPMLAGDSEIVQAIQDHYREEKKPAAATPAQAAPGRPVPAGAGAGAPNAAAAPSAAPEFPRRFTPSSATPVAGTARATPLAGAPYIPPPIPAAAPKPVQKLEEIEPDESMSVPTPPPTPLDLPEDDGQEMGLEPIAAHSQFGEEVAGSEEVEGAGSAGDVVEGLESAGVPHEGAVAAAQMEGLEPIAAHSQVPVPEGGWGAEVAHAEGWQADALPAEGWQADALPAEGWQADATPAAAEQANWTGGAPAAPAAGPRPRDFGAAHDWSAGQERGGWSAEPPPAAAGGEAAWGPERAWGDESSAESQAAEAAPADAAGEELPMDAIIGIAETVEGVPEAAAYVAAAHDEAAAPVAAMYDDAVPVEAARDDAVPVEAARDDAVPYVAAAPEGSADDEAVPYVAAAHEGAPVEVGPDEISQEAANEPAHDEAARDEPAEDETAEDETAEDEAAREKTADDEAAAYLAAAYAAAAHDEAAHRDTAGEAAADDEAAHEEQPREHMPMDEAPAESAEAPDGWSSIEDPLAAGSEVPAWRHAAPAEQSWAVPVAEHLAAGENAPGSESSEQARPSTDRFALVGAAADSESVAATESVTFADTVIAESVTIESATAAETEAPPEWAEAPAEAPQQEPLREEQTEAAATQEFAAVQAPQEETSAEEEVPSEDISIEEPAPEAAAAGEIEEQGELKLEGWVAPPPEPEPQGVGWFGEALGATMPLSAADAGTLGSLGVDPNDGVGALRLLAALMRILNRRQLLEIDEIAGEVRESRSQAVAERAAAERDVNGVPAPGRPESPDEAQPPATPTET